MDIEQYNTIMDSSEGFFKDRGSKFIARLKHVETEEDCKAFLNEVKKEFYDARHHCYAYRLDPDDGRFRSNDDGEPAGSAGKPILNQLLSHELFNVMVIVVRYFGGTKLGVSGLINAYKLATKEAIELAKVEIKHLTKAYLLHFEYPKLNDVMRVIKEENISILEQDFTDKCFIKIEIKKSQIEKALFKFDNMYELEINPLENS